MRRVLARFALVLAVFPCSAPAQHPEGFIGYRWGTPVSEIRQTLALVQVREDGRYALYEAGSVPFDGMELRNCGLEFVDGKLAGGFCQTRGAEDSRRLRHGLERQMGKPMSARPRTAQWSGMDTYADYDEDELGNAYLYAYSRRLNELVAPER